MAKLKAEMMDDRIFRGWKEGVITFAPTYKYFPNSDQYHGCSQGSQTLKKRTPAWYNLMQINQKLQHYSDIL